MSTVKKVTATYKTNLNTNHDEELILNVIDFYFKFLIFSASC